MPEPSTYVEHKDALQHLRAMGFGPLLDALQDPDCFTKHGDGRLLLERLGRRLNVSAKTAAKMLLKAQAALA